MGGNASPAHACNLFLFRGDSLLPLSSTPVEEYKKDWLNRRYVDVTTIHMAEAAAVAV